MKSETLSLETAEYINKLKRGLQTAGKDLNTLTPLDLAPADEFHVRGTEAIQEMIAAANISADDHVLDLGCGLGGPARILASTTGCRVTGYDLSQLSIEAGNLLSTWTGLTEAVTLIEADATAIPAEDAHYDVAWTIHVGMFIKDKQAFYGEAARLLKPGGTFILFDPVPIGGGKYHYPVPWARTIEEDHSLTQVELE